MSASRTELEAAESVRPHVFVETMRVYPENRRVSIPFTGEVRASRRYPISFQVSGVVKRQHPKLMLGGRIEEGEVLLELDDAEYQLKLQESRARLAVAESELQLEKGRQAIAKRELEMYSINGEVEEEAARLARREPQLKARMAEVLLAESQVATAELQVERCTIRAEEAWVVVEEQVELGQFVERGTEVATLVSAVDWEVLACVSASDLAYLEEGNAAKIRWGGSEVDGALVSKLKQVEERTRKGEVLLKFEYVEGILAGSFVEGSLWGRILEDVFVLPRELLSAGNAVWVKDSNGGLKRIEVKPVWAQGKSVFVKGNFGSGSEVVLDPNPGRLQGKEIRWVKRSQERRSVSES